MSKKKITRREFVSRVTLGAGIITLGKTLPYRGLLPADLPSDPLQMVTLGKSGIRTTLLGMGTGFNGYNRSSAITRAGTAETVIRHAWDSGIRFFDCADTYGTHPFVAKSLKGLPRDNYVLSSKIWVGRGGVPEPERPDADVVVDRFRKELGTEYIDIIQLHCMTSAGWTDEYKKQMDLLDNLKARGIIRAHGVSVHSLEAMEAAAASPWVDVIHVRINPFGAAMDDSDPAKVARVIEKLHASGKGVIGMKLIGNGSFSNDSDKINTSIRYVLGLGTVDMIIAGFEKPEQIDNYKSRIVSAVNIIRARDEGISSILAPGAILEKLADGFLFTEGPTADNEGNVYFTDQPNNRIMVWDTKSGLSVFMQPAGRSNGMSFDKEGNLWSCADEKDELWKISRAKKVEVVVKNYDGKPLNGPNDLWISPSGGIYLTDPFYKRDWWDHDQMPQEKQCVYYLKPDHKSLVRVADDLVQPNGIVGTPDGKTLFVADIRANKTWSYSIDPDGGLSGKRLFCEMGSDGMTIDSEGNLYLTGAGVTVFDKTGRRIGNIPVPESWTANVCFGDRDFRSLYITASKGLYRIKLKVPGTRG